MRRIRDAYETVIVGGGIIGAATAYFLAKSGREVLVVERYIPASGSSGACDGTIFIQSKPTGPKLAMAVRSAALYSKLSHELKYRLGYVQHGGMILMETDEEVSILEKIASAQKAEGANIEIIDGDEARHKQPGLSERVIKATWCPDDAHVNPIFATFALLNTAIDLGCDFLKGNEVTGVRTLDRRIASISVRDMRTGAERRIITKNIVNAAGVWAPSISAMVGLDTPVIPRKGEILITEQVDPILTGIYLEARYIAVKHNPKIAENSNDSGLRKGVGLVLEQTVDGNMLIGSSREFVGMDRNATQSVVTEIARRAIHFFPVLKNMVLIRSFAGLRPYTPDGLPYVGKTRTVEGFIMAAGHEGDGIALAPETGRCLAEVVINGECDVLVDLSPDRLAK
jgi:sarcosine oxidase subunit beta